MTGLLALLKANGMDAIPWQLVVLEPVALATTLFVCGWVATRQYDMPEFPVAAGSVCGLAACVALLLSLAYS